MSDVTIGLKRSAVLCILKHDDQLLLLLRSKEPHLGKYIPVGGKVEPFECPADAARREVREETGLDLPNLKFCGTMVETSPTKFNWVNFIYCADVSLFSPKENEEGTMEWVRASDISKIPTPTTDRFIYEFILSGKIFMFNAIYNEKIELIELCEEIENKVLYRSEHSKRKI
jgi:8-oxo-dGTP diphosphatase